MRMRVTKSRKFFCPLRQEETKEVVKLEAPIFKFHDREPKVQSIEKEKWKVTNAGTKIRERKYKLLNQILKRRDSNP